MDVLVLPVDGEFYSIPMDAVREVIARPKATEVPHADAALCGLLNVRGEIVPLFDAAQLLGVGATDGRDFAVMVEVPAGSAGLVASAAPTSEVLGEKVRDSEHAAGRGIYRQGARLATLLDLTALFAPLH